MTAPQELIVRQYELPHQGGSFCCTLTGQWTVLNVENRFGISHLIVLEEPTGTKSAIEFRAVATNVAVPAEQVCRVYLGSYAAPGNMFHVFGPRTSRVE